MHLKVYVVQTSICKMVGNGKGIQRGRGMKIGKERETERKGKSQDGKREKTNLYLYKKNIYNVMPVFREKQY